MVGSYVGHPSLPTPQGPSPQGALSAVSSGTRITGSFGRVLSGLPPTPAVKSTCRSPPTKQVVEREALGPSLY